MIVVSEPAPGTRVELDQGGMLAVRLPERASSGYRWAVAAAGGLSLRASREVPGHDAPGAAAVREFLFEAGTPGTHTLSLKYWRDWQGDGSVLRRCELDVVVR